MKTKKQTKTKVKRPTECDKNGHAVKSEKIGKGTFFNYCARCGVALGIS